MQDLEENPYECRLLIDFCEFEISVVLSQNLREDTRYRLVVVQAQGRRLVVANLATNKIDETLDLLYYNIT